MQHNLLFHDHVHALLGTVDGEVDACVDLGHNEVAGVGGDLERIAELLGGHFGKEFERWPVTLF